MLKKDKPAKPDKKTADKSASAKSAPAKAAPAKAVTGPAKSAPAKAPVDPKAAMKLVLDAEITKLQAELAAMKKKLPAADPRLETYKNRIRARQIQRAKLG